MKLEVIKGTPNYEHGYQEFNRILRDEQEAIKLGDLNTISKLILTGVNFVVQWGHYSHERKFHHEIQMLLAVAAVVDEAIKLAPNTVNGALMESYAAIAAQLQSDLEQSSGTGCVKTNLPAGGRDYLKLV